MASRRSSSSTSSSSGRAPRPRPRPLVALFGVAFFGVAFLVAAAPLLGLFLGGILGFQHKIFGSCARGFFSISIPQCFLFFSPAKRDWTWCFFAMMVTLTRNLVFETEVTEWVGFEKKTSKMDETQGFLTLWYSNWTNCSPLSWVCSKLFLPSWLLYWGRVEEGKREGAGFTKKWMKRKSFWPCHNFPRDTPALFLRPYLWLYSWSSYDQERLQQTAHCLVLPRWWGQACAFAQGAGGLTAKTQPLNSQRSSLPVCLLCTVRRKSTGSAQNVSRGFLQIDSVGIIQ